VKPRRDAQLTGVAAHVGLMSVYGLPTSFALNVRELDLL